jgi:hypothetical protein
VRPARLGRYPEDGERAVLIGILGIGAAGLLGDELRVLFLEGVGDVLEEDQTEHHVLILGGVHAAAQGVGSLPQFFFKTQIGPFVVLGHISYPLLNRRFFAPPQGKRKLCLHER